MERKLYISQGTHSIGRQALGILQSFGQETAEVDCDRLGADVAAHTTLLIVSPGIFASQYLRCTPELPELRLQDIKRRGFQVRPWMLEVRHLVILRPTHDGACHRKSSLKGFSEALANLCGCTYVDPDKPTKKERTKNWPRPRGSGIEHVRAWDLI